MELTPEQIDAILRGGATPANAAPAAVEAAPGPIGRIAQQVPTLLRGAKTAGTVVKAGGGLLSRFLPWTAGAAATGGEVLGTMDKAADPASTGLDVATRAAEGVGRLGSMAAGAGLGAVAAGPVGGAIGGTLGYFAPNAIYAVRDWLRGDTPKPPAAAAPAPVVVHGSGGGAAPAVAVPAAAAPAAPVVPPFTSADIDGNRVPLPGMGAFRNNRTGVVTNLDTRDPAGFGAAPGAPAGYADLMGRAFAGKMQMQMEGNRQKAEQALALKSPEAFKNMAEAQAVQMRVTEAQRAKARGASEAEIASILAGRNVGVVSDAFTSQPTLDPNKIDVTNKHTGEVKRITPMPQITEADIQHTMQINKMSRDQVVARLKLEGKM